MKIQRFLIFPVILIIFLSGCRDNTRPGEAIEPITGGPLVVENIFPFQEEHCHASTIVELPNKDLLVAWFQGSGERRADDVNIFGSRYNSDEKTWSEPFVMANVPDFPDINPVLFIDNEGILWLTWYTVMAYQWESSLLKFRYSRNYLQKSGPPEWEWQDMIYVRADGPAPDGIGKNDRFVSTLERKYEDYYQYLISSGIMKEGENIAESKRIWERSINRYLNIARGLDFIKMGYDTNDAGQEYRTRLGYPLMRRIGWQTRNKPLIIGNRILLPIYSDGFNFSMVAITENRGRNWSFSEPIVGIGNVQPSFVLCKDSTIVAYMRNNGPQPHRLMKSVSADLGNTWSTVEETEIPNPASAADIIGLKSGSWVLISNDLEEGRERLSVWLSEDEGKTWPFKKAIVSGPEESQVMAHYPAIIQGSDGIIHVSYTNQIPDNTVSGSVKSIVHASFSEEWIKN